MAEPKTQKIEREYTIPLRRFWLGMPQYERTGRAVKTIKKFIAKHMKVPERDVNKVKLDVYFNNELWFRGRASPPSKIKVKATKEGDIVTVTFAEMPQYVKFLKAKNERIHKKSDKKETPKVEEKKEEKTDDEKNNEKEKETAVAESKAKEAKMESKVQKHVSSKPEKAQHPQRMALQK